ncbi:unnamed protein product [Cylicocyclus nassatus]|uniref:SXP/RAL-2 family protein Ani s 5-like cation-binding domain-containing protein n=1 Tax=Cylicocyclus nassatus TaxID=53992 RepID=A0AA36M9S5_CYLNA|nr:unnamed protein product [Cylicocyclus nassatus]
MNKALAILALIGIAVLAQPDFNDFQAETRGTGGRWGGGPGGRPGRRPHGPPPPPFLRDVNEVARSEYFAILKDMNKTITQQKQEINTWAEKYGISDKVKEFEANMTRFKEEIKENVTELVSQLPQAVQRVSDIMDNEDQTPREVFKNLRKLTEENPNLFRLAKFAADIFMKPRGPRGGPRGGTRGRGGPGGPPPPPPPFGGPDDDFEGPGFGGQEFGQNNGFGGPGGFNGQNSRGFRGFRV